MTAGPVIRWSAFVPAAGADRRTLRELGRSASRAAFRLAAAAWAERHGPADWCLGEVANDPSGAPVVAGFPAAPAISIAHTRGLGGCAIAAPGGPVPGIDAEPVDAPAAASLRALAAETGEDRLPWRDDHWPLRLWCAKESAVKSERAPADALGRSLRVEEAGPLAADGRQRVVVRTHRGRPVAVWTEASGAHVRAWTE